MLNKATLYICLTVALHMYQYVIVPFFFIDNTLIHVILYLEFILFGIV